MPLPSWISRLFRRPEPEPDVRRNLILFDVTAISSMTVPLKQHVCDLLHQKAVERGLATSIVDFETFIFGRAVKARRFDGSGREFAQDRDIPILEELILRSDIMWLMRNRDRLMREALSAGGDAEYVFMKFQGNPEDFFLNMDHDLNKRIVIVHYYPHEDTNLGNHVAVGCDGQSVLFKMPEDNWSADTMAPILNHIIKICQGR